MARFCRYCGRQLNENAKFCVACGKPTAQSGASAQGQPIYGQPVSQPPAYRQQPTYGRQPQAAPVPPRKRKSPVVPILIIALCALLVVVGVTGFIAPGFFLHKSSDSAGGGQAVVTTAEIVIPKPTAAEAVVNATACMGIEYYNAARMYLEKIISFDPEKGTPEELEELVDTTIAAFEKAEKMSEAMDAAVDLWINTDEEREAPTFTVHTETFGEEALSDFELFPMTVYAKEDSPAVKWARDITDRFDKAPAGKGIRTLASQLGTDAKHAYAQLKQAQAILEGSAYSDFAETANTYYKTATTLKTAGTVAGFVIAAAPIASGAAVATMTEAVVTVGGAYISGANAALELTSTGAMLYNNGEDNMISRACDKVEQKLAPVGAVFSLASAGYNVRNIFQKSGELLKDVKTYSEGSKILLKSTEATEDFAGIFLYSAGSTKDYLTDGTVMGVSFSQKKDGLHVTIEDTQTGTGPAQKQAVEKVLTDAGVDPGLTKEAMRLLDQSAGEQEPGGSPTDKLPKTNENLPEDFVDDYLKEHKKSTPAEDDFDIDDYLNKLRELLYEIAALEDGEDTEETEVPTEVPEETEAPTETVFGPLTIGELEGTYYIDGFAAATIQVTGANSLTMTNLSSGYSWALAVDTETWTAVSDKDDQDGIVTYHKLTFSRGENGGVVMDWIWNLNGTDIPNGTLTK